MSESKYKNKRQKDKGLFWFACLEKCHIFEEEYLYFPTLSNIIFSRKDINLGKCYFSIYIYIYRRQSSTFHPNKNLLRSHISAYFLGGRPIPSEEYEKRKMAFGKEQCLLVKMRQLLIIMSPLKWPFPYLLGLPAWQL